jgi:TPR repeat protein
MSYIDLLNDLPYSQQVAPAPMMNNISLQSAVGNNASLLDNKKTLDMYRANVKKTNDPSIQYEFAIFMINAARDHAEDTESAAELIKEARGILQRLSDRAYPFAQYYLADGYFSGLFNKDKPDYDKALPLFVAASKHGHAESGYRAALCYEFGWGCTKNYPKAVQFFRAAASKGHPGAAIRLGKACLTGDMGLVNRYREGVKWLKRATDSADYQYNSGPYELGLLHITGFGEDIFKDEAYAAQLMTKSAELGHAEANYRMGQAYENGTFGCPKDAALSVHFYNGAASKGLPEAMMALCAWYMVGAEPVLEKDEVEAYEWSKRAAELGKSTTPTTLVKLYANRIQQGSQRPSTPSDTLPKWASDVVVTLSKRMCGTSRLPTRATRRLNNDSTLLERQLLAILAYLWPRVRPRQKSSVAARKRSASSCKFDETKRSF